MKNKVGVMWSIMLLTALVGCSNVYTVTDTVKLYPANHSAQQWGALTFYSQYRSHTLPSNIQVALPNGERLNGQMTFIEDSGIADNDDRFGRHLGVGGYGWWLDGMPSHAHSTYRSDKQNVSVNLFNKLVSMNCHGDFNRRQKVGALKCQLTNDMQYRGTIRRTITH